MQDQPPDPPAHKSPGDPDPSHAESRSCLLSRTIAPKGSQPITYCPGDYLFDLAAKVVLYVSDPEKPLDAELRTHSQTVRDLRNHAQPCKQHPHVIPATDAEEDWVRRVLEDMHAHPSLQQPFAYLVDYVPSKWLLEQEAAIICKARAIHGSNPHPWPPPAKPAQASDSGQPPASAPPINRLDPATWQSPDNVYQWAREAGLRGLCLSGGGIRSATFNLGILQGLAAKQKLNRFDYLSSISGGGYIHSWLAAWLRRESDRTQLRHPPTPTLSPQAASNQAIQDQNTRDVLRQVQEEMAPIPGEPQKDGKPRLAAHELRWLRQFSNYLTPEKGVFSLDTWTAVAVWLRNTSLNQLCLISALLCMLLFPWLLSALWQTPRDAHNTTNTQPPAAAVKSTPELKSTTPAAADKPTAPNEHAVSPSPSLPNAPPKERATDKFKTDYRFALAQEVCNPVLAPHSCLPATGDPKLKTLPALANVFKARLGSTTVKLEFITFFLFVAGAISLGTLLQLEFLFTHKHDEDERLRTENKTENKPATENKHPENTHTDEHAQPNLPRSALARFLGAPARAGHSVRDHLQEKFLSSPRHFGGPWHIGLTVLALLLPAVPFCYALCYPGPGPLEVAYAAIGFFSLCICVAAGGNAFCRPGQSGLGAWLMHSFWRQLLASVGASLLGTAVFMLIAALIRTATMEQWGATLMRCSIPGVELVFGVPLLASLPFFTVSILIGLVGHSFVDWLRELLGRVLAMTLLATLAWLGLFAITLLSPGFFLTAMHNTPVKVSTVVAWLATTAGAVISGKSAKTSGSSAPAKGVFNAELLATVGPYVYILGLLIILSLLVQLWVDVEGALTRIWVALAVCAGLALLLGWRLDATAFSMFPFYRNRLTRCYLGASNRSRQPNPLTGFDDRDTHGLQLSSLLPGQGYPGPFPIFGTTLNLTTGAELAYQERKGASFAFTPLYSGYAVSWTEARPGTQFNGYVPTESYGALNGGFNIATAVAISGAAVSPNMGYHTKPATAFLLTMFNARLGRWLPNTRRLKNSGRRHNNAQPEDGSSPDGRVLLNELFGRTDDSLKFIYLTDGGHFDNMGLYELVRRRCYHIVICDAEQDEEYTFDGIGSTIRKCRIDFGVEINLNLSELRRVAATRFSSAHVVTGTIRYPESQVDPHAPTAHLGTITYIKASLVTFKPATPPDASTPSDLPDLPGDVQSYYLQHKEFPHDSTLEQWFTESQFESYRRLGQAVMESIPSVIPDNVFTANN